MGRIRNHDALIKGVLENHGEDLAQEGFTHQLGNLGPGVVGLVYNMVFDEKSKICQPRGVLLYTKTLFNPNTQRETVYSQWVHVENEPAYRELSLSTPPRDPIYLSRNGRVLLNHLDRKLVEKLKELSLTLGA